MAFSYKQGREYQSRFERGYRTTKYSKGYDRWGMPIICGLIDADGNRAHVDLFSKNSGQSRSRPNLRSRSSWCSSHSP